MYSNMLMNEFITYVDQIISDDPTLLLSDVTPTPKSIGVASIIYVTTSIPPQGSARRHETIWVYDLDKRLSVNSSRIYLDSENDIRLDIINTLQKLPTIGLLVLPKNMHNLRYLSYLCKVPTVVPKWTYNGLDNDVARYLLHFKEHILKDNEEFMESLLNRRKNPA